MGSAASAWCPGGRAATKATSPSPRASASTASSPAPAANSAVSHDPGCRHRVGVDRAAAGVAEGVQRFEIRQRMDQCQLVLGGPPRLELDDRVAQPSLRRSRPERPRHGRDVQGGAGRHRGGRATGTPPAGAPPHCTASPPTCGRDRPAVRSPKTLKSRRLVARASSAIQGTQRRHAVGSPVPRAILHACKRLHSGRTPSRRPSAKTSLPPRRATAAQPTRCSVGALAPSVRGRFKTNPSGWLSTHARYPALSSQNSWHNGVTSRRGSPGAPGTARPRRARSRVCVLGRRAALTGPRDGSAAPMPSRRASHDHRRLRAMDRPRASAGGRERDTRTSTGVAARSEGCSPTHRLGRGLTEDCRRGDRDRLEQYADGWRDIVPSSMADTSRTCASAAATGTTAPMPSGLTGRNQRATGSHLPRPGWTEVGRGLHELSQAEGRERRVVDAGER